MDPSHPLDRTAADSFREESTGREGSTGREESTAAERPGRGQTVSRIAPLASDPAANVVPAAPIATAPVTAAPIATAWDAELAAALRDVPVPSGLTERLLARLQVPDVAHSDPAPIARLAVAGRERRRWLKASAVGLACAASIAVAILLLNQPTAELGSESVMELVRAFHNHQPAAQPLRHDAAPADYLPGNFVMPGCVVGWTRLAGPLLGRAGVAYQLTGPRQNRATLYVVDFDGPRSAPRLWLNATSPMENLLTTDGQTSASWTDGVRLYVLVADGDEQAFRALVRAPRSMA